MNKPLLTIKQVCERTGLSQPAVYQLLHSGELEHYQLGSGLKKNRRISEEQLSAFLEKRHLIAAQERKNMAARNIIDDLVVCLSGFNDMEPETVKQAVRRLDKDTLAKLGRQSKKLNQLLEAVNANH